MLPLLVIYSALALVPLSATSLQLYTQNQSTLHDQQQQPLGHLQEADQPGGPGYPAARKADEPLSASNSSTSFSNTTTTTTTTGPPDDEPQVVVSPSGQLRDFNGSDGSQTPSPSFYYGDEPRSNREENLKDDSDLNFSLMNAPHERIQAVKNLLNSQNNNQLIPMAQELDSKPQQYYQQQQQTTQNTGNSMQCTHKGRQYLHGQSVPIEEQPCLNCTCRRAVLQCFLRVCPPIISLEAQRRMQQIVSLENGNSAQRCRMAKDPSQCCPSLRCEPEQKADQMTTTTTSNSTLASSSSNRKSQYQVAQPFKGHPEQVQNSDASIVSLDNGAADHLRVEKTKEDEGSVMEYHLQQQQNHQSMNNRSYVNQQQQQQQLSTGASSRQQMATSSSTTTTSVPATNDDDHLPRLTVINGATGQRDSILLITSNPNSHNHHHHNHHSQQHQVGNSSERGMVGQGNSGGGGRQDYAHALMEALLETVYSSAAQLNGLNLQGSCMINGSLYVEGSAVIPEGSAICQYCYCIRQKIMCVRPKCHLIISGCSPKYSNEYACCPTSYSCSNSESSSSSSSALVASIGGGGQTRLAADGSPQTRPSQNLSSRLWAALESAIGSHMPTKLSLMDATNLGATRSLNQESAASGGTLPEHPASNSTTSSMDPRGLSLGKSPEVPTTQNSSESIVNPANGNTTSGHPIDETKTSTQATTSTSTSTTTTSPIKPSEPISADQPMSRVVYDYQPPVAFDQMLGGRTRDNEASDETTADGDGDGENQAIGRSRISGGGQNQGDELSERAMDKDMSERSAVALGTPGEAMVAQSGDQQQQHQQPYTVMANVTTEQPSSLSDFLEPMNKLGPLVVSPSAPSGCVENNRQYAIGEQIPTLESCKHCYCGLEGLKECKMIECSLKVVHNCRPITPEGHCCPIRYECPQSINSHTGHNDLMMATRNRYRSEETSVPDGAGGSGSQEQWMMPSVSSTPFSGGPCKGDTGDASSSGDDCRGEDEEEAGSNTNGAGTTTLAVKGDHYHHNHSSSSSTGSADENSKESAAPLSLMTTSSMDPATSVSASEMPNSLMVDTTTPSAIQNTNTNETIDGDGENATSSSVLRNESVSLNLTEELNKFIMQIKQSGGTVSSTTVAAPRGTDYSLVTGPTPTTNETSQEMMISDQQSRMVDYHSVQAAPGTTPTSLLASSSPPVIPKGMVGIPSIRVEPITNEPPATTPGSRFANDNFPRETTGSHDQQQASQRDSRSTSVDGLDTSHHHDRSNQRLSSSDLRSSPEPISGNNQQTPTGAGGDQSSSSNTMQDYSLDYRTTTSSGEIGQLRGANLTLYDTRSLEEDSQPVAQGSGSGSQVANYRGSPPSGATVLFDDDLGIGDSSLDSVHHKAASLMSSTIVPSTTSNIVTETGATNPVSTPPVTTGGGIEDVQTTTGTSLGMETDRATPEPNAGWLHSLTGVVRSFGRRFTGSGSGSSSSYSPGQTLPSTSPPPSSKLQGRHELTDAAGTDANPSSALDEKPPVGQTSSSQYDYHETARSRSTSLLDQLFKSVIGGTSGQDLSPPKKEPQLGPLIMRPIVSNDEQPAVAKNQDSPMLQPHESPVEIVTAMEANEPEIFTQPSQVSPEVQQPGMVANRIGQAQSQFSRRSDLSDGDDLMSMASTTMASVAPQRYFAPPSVGSNPSIVTSNFAAADATSHQSGPNSVRLMGGSFIGMVPAPRASGQPGVGATRPVQKALTCYEPATNRTYQPNEIILKDDPCKTCTCVLGEELCQTLVCPEKPGENCKEERRPGECCANYLCGSNVSSPMVVQQTPPSASSSPSAQHPMPQPISVKPIFTHRPMAGSSRSADLPSLPSNMMLPSARLLASQENNNNLPRETGGRLVAPSALAAQRAMIVDSAFGTLSNGLEQQQRQPQIQQQPARPTNQNQQLQQQNFINQLNQLQQQQQQQPQIPMLQTQSFVGNRARIPIDSSRQRQQLPQHPIRTSDLANLLPPHLRFRPTGLPKQAPMAGGGTAMGSLPAAGQNMPQNNVDNRNKMLFNNAGQRISPEHTMQANPMNSWFRNDPTASNNLQRGQQILPNVLWGQFNSQRTQPAASAVRQQVLLAPQRSTSGNLPSNLSGPLQTRPTSSDDSSSSMRRQPIQAPPPPPPQLSSQIDRLNTSPLGAPVPNSNNVLMPRMSGQQVPGDDHNNLQHQASAAATGTSQPSSGDAGWQPNNGPVLLQSTTLPPASLVFKNPLNPLSPDASQVAAEPVVSNRQTTEGDIIDKQRVLFDQQAKASVIPSDIPSALSSNSVDTGGPQPPTISTQATSGTTKNESLPTTDEGSLTIANHSPAEETVPPSSTTTGSPMIPQSSILVPEVNASSKSGGSGTTINFPDQFFLSTQQPSLLPDELKSSSSSETPASELINETDQNTVKQISESSTISTTTQQEMLPSSSALPAATTTSLPATPTITTTPRTLNDPTRSDPSEAPKSSEESTGGNGSTSGEQTDDSGTSSDFDPLAMFRVSECNIYGRIYGVGQAIEELSDVCKSCTCTQMGVDCQSKC